MAGVLATPFSIFVLEDLGFPFDAGLPLPLALGIMMSIALLLHSIGFFGLWRNLESRVALAAFGFGLVATILFMVTLVLALTPLFSLAPVGIILVGVMFIIEGAAYFANRHVLLEPSCTAAGVLFIIAGVFLASLFLGFVRGIIAVPALFLGGILLLKAPVPVGHAPPIV